ncbi:hypothetical protein CHS0354_023770 [Potamilus streckersoni]|uniref:FAD-binding PCMH-type domain-containing protein n=1 Tax=Potamilus streckersoni TaxID=2493646 RepID=A0AAE0RYU1_9BIVA|nr:hypothetical protein CHS0354_023770 [Potamilus streckersoni]
MWYGVLGKIRRVHIVGIGGAGMSAIAHVLAGHGILVTGSDVAESRIIEALRQIGVTIFIGHHKNNILGAQVIAYSSAINTINNVEILEAKKKGVPTIKRDELLGELMKRKCGICISGTHGKTTTTAMVGTLLCELGADPTTLIGGYSDYFKGSTFLGKGDIIVLESDEYDKAFLKLTPTISVITNIEKEHVDTYQGGLEEIRTVFLEFANKIPFYGKVIGCVDNHEVRSLFQNFKKEKLSYGIDCDEADLKGTNIIQNEAFTEFDVIYDRKILCTRVRIYAFGKHNVQNAIAAIGVGLELGFDVDKIKDALEKFSPIKRRFQIRYSGESVVIDDYAHHPTEIAVTLKTAREIYKDRKIVAILQPHLYSRTKALCYDFANSLQLADTSFVTEIYPSRENVNDFPEVTSELIYKKMANAQYVEKDDLQVTMKEYVLKEPFTVFVFMGADLRTRSKGTVQISENISKYTTMKVGGTSDYCYFPQSKEDLIEAIRYFEEINMPYFILGRGSNIIISDEGIRGVTILLKESLNKYEIRAEKVYVEAGVDLPALVLKLLKLGYGGLENLSGIPGSVGGALIMNAGAYGSEIFDFVDSVEIYEKGHVLEIKKVKLKSGYRGSGLFGKVVLSCILLIKKITEKEKDDLLEKRRMLLNRRKESQPLNFPNTGCVFKNPQVLIEGKKQFAGKLIEECGLKGFRLGGAMVSDLHANFILNMGNATSRDVIMLIDIIKNKVMQRFGINLDLEVKLVGFDTVAVTNK